MNEMTRSEFQVPKIKAVEPGDGDYVLDLTWQDGLESCVDLTEPIFRLKYLRPLRNKGRFGEVAVADWGWAIAWSEELDFSGEKLWQMAEEQKFAVMLPSKFRLWLDRHHLTQQDAANLLGMSKRSISYYATGAQPITRTIALALKGAETEMAMRH